MNGLTVGELIQLARRDSILGIYERDEIIGLAERALELAVYKANFDLWMDTIDVASDACGVVTLPSCVGIVLSVNVGGAPTILRDNWYQFHVNGFGDRCGPGCLYSTMALPSPVWQQPKEWSLVVAMCEDATDGDGSKTVIVQGETMDASGNIKPAITIPVTGPSEVGIKIPLITNWANTDSAANPTFFRKITQVFKPVTRGYVKLLAFPMKQMALSRVVGYYAPTETMPLYQQLSVKAACAWVRVRFRRNSIRLVADHDLVPISSKQAMANLLKAVRFSDSNDIVKAQQYTAVAVETLREIQSLQQGNKYSPIQIENGWGVGTIDFR